MAPQRSRVVNLNWFTKRNLLEQNSPESQDSHVINTVGSIYSLIFLSLESFFLWFLLPIHQEVESPCIPYWGVETPCVFPTGESRLPRVFITKESFWSPGSHLTDLKKHITTFKDYLSSWKLDCRLLQLIRDMWFMFENIAFPHEILIGSPTSGIPLQKRIAQRIFENTVFQIVSGRDYWDQEKLFADKISWHYPFKLM